MLDRPDVARRFDEASVRRVTVLAAPPGFGKSAAIEARLQSRHGSFVRYGLRRADASLAPFVRSLAAAFADTLPGVLATLSTAYDRAMKTARPGHELGVWLAAHLGAVPRTVVLDDLHYGEGDAAIAALVASAVERTGPDVRWILAVRSVEPLPFVRWLDSGDAAPPIDANVLRLSNDEALAIGAPLAPMLAPATILRLRDRTDGAAGVFAFALRTLAGDAALVEPLLSTSGDAFERVADFVFARLTSEERTRLIESVVFPESEAPAGSWLDALEERAPQIFRSPSGRRQYLELFHRYLRDRLEERGAEGLRAATARLCGERGVALPEPAGEAVAVRRRPDDARLPEPKARPMPLRHTKY